MQQQQHRVAYFVTDHGFGHAARASPIISELIDRGVPVLVVSKVVHDFLLESIPNRKFDYFPNQTDCGVYQLSSIAIDVEKTQRIAFEFWDSMSERIRVVAAHLRTWRCTVIVFDIPALAPLVAAELNINCIAISNFSWDWIYSAYLQQAPQFAQLIERHKQAYSKTNLFLQLPYTSRELHGFNGVATKQISLLARRSAVSREDTLRKLGLDLRKRYLLYSFGGHPMPIEEYFAKWKIPTDWSVIWVSQNDSSQPFSSNTGSVNVLAQKRLQALEVKYIDLLRSVDVVVCKTGYGIVSEAIVNGVAVIYVDRPGFLEHGYLETALQENVACAQASNDEILWLDERLFEKARNISPNSIKPKCAFDGAREAADAILSFDRSKSSDYPKYHSCIL